MTAENWTRLDYRVPYADTDQMKVVYYANYFVYFERLRNELIRESGVAYTEIERSGLMFPVVEAHAEYHGGARYDDLLRILGRVEWIQGSRFRVLYEIYREEELLVTGSTIHTTLTLEGRPRRVPDTMKKLLSPEDSPG